jgi:cytochrome c551/c552
MRKLNRSTDTDLVERCSFVGAVGLARCAFIALSTCLIIGCVLAGRLAAQTQAQSAYSAKPLSQSEMARMAPNDLAKYVFENHGCKNCHTLETNGKFGFTEQGKAVSKGFEGCIALLTSMNVVTQVKEENRTAEEKQKAVRFKEFGCTECHQIVPGKMGLTKEGAQLKSLHMSCPDIQKLLTSK